MPQQAAKTQNVIHLPCLPLLFVAYPFKGSSAVSCISWRRIPGQKQKDAAQIYFFYQLTEAHRNGQKQAAGRAHPPPVSGSRQRAISCTAGGRSPEKAQKAGWLSSINTQKRDTGRGHFFRFCSGSLTRLLPDAHTGGGEKQTESGKSARLFCVRNSTQAAGLPAASAGGGSRQGDTGRGYFSARGHTEAAFLRGRHFPAQDHRGRKAAHTGSGAGTSSACIRITGSGLPAASAGGGSRQGDTGRGTSSARCTQRRTQGRKNEGKICGQKVKI